MNDIDFGDVPSWIAAVTSLLAFGAAVFAAIFTWRTLSIENSREARTEKRAEEEQANKIACWISDSDSENFELSGHKYKAIGVNMNIANASQQAIYEISISLFDKEAVLHVEKVSVIAPDSTATIPIPIEIVNRFLPNHLQNVIGTVTKQAENESKRIAESLQLEITFMDSKGIYWRRGRKGNLIKF
jgi:hypothetical protein